MTELLKGKTEAEANALFGAFHRMCTEDAAPEIDKSLEDEFDRLQVLSGVRNYPMRVKCATLAWHTMKAALEGAAEPVKTE
jgi:nitrogen fixation NifU-like protein